MFMMPYSPKLMDIMFNLTNAEKVRLFYELAKSLNNYMVLDATDEEITKMIEAIESIINIANG